MRASWLLLNFRTCSCRDRNGDDDRWGQDVPLVGTGEAFCLVGSVHVSGLVSFLVVGEVLQGRIALLHYGIELEASRFPTFRVEVVVTGDAVKVLMVQKLANDVSIKSLQSFTSPAARFDTLAVRKPLAV